MIFESLLPMVIHSPVPQYTPEVVRTLAYGRNENSAYRQYVYCCIDKDDSFVREHLFKQTRDLYWALKFLYNNENLVPKYKQVFVQTKNTIAKLQFCEMFPSYIDNELLRSISNTMDRDDAWTVFNFCSLQYIEKTIDARIFKVLVTNTKPTESNTSSIYNFVCSYQGRNRNRIRQIFKKYLLKHEILSTSLLYLYHIDKDKELEDMVGSKPIKLLMPNMYSGPSRLHIDLIIDGATSHDHRNA